MLGDKSPEEAGSSSSGSAMVMERSSKRKTKPPAYFKAFSLSLSKVSLSEQVDKVRESTAKRRRLSKTAEEVRVVHDVEMPSTPTLQVEESQPTERERESQPAGREEESQPAASEE